MRPGLLFVINLPSAHLRGGARSGLLLARNLRAFRPLVVLIRGTGNAPQLCEKGEMEIKVPFPLSLYGLRRGGPKVWARFIVAFLWANFNIALTSLKHGARLIHCNELPEFIASFLAGKLMRRKVILHIRGFPSMRWIWRTCIRLADLVVVVSDHLRERVLSKVPHASNKTICIYNPIDFTTMRKITRSLNREEVRNRLGLRKEECAVGYIGVLGPKKRQLAFLREVAIPACRKLPCVSFYFIGPPDEKFPEYFGKCKELVRKEGIEERVRFVGYQKEMEQWYHGLDVVALASKEEGLPRSLIEAMAMGKPVVCTDNISPRPLLEREETRRFVVDFNHPDEFVDRLIELCRDKSLREKVGRACLDIARRFFDIKAIVDQMERKYAVLLHGGIEG